MKGELRDNCPGHRVPQGLQCARHSGDQESDLAVLLSEGILSRIALPWLP